MVFLQPHLKSSTILEKYFPWRHKPISLHTAWVMSKPSRKPYCNQSAQQQKLDSNREVEGHKMPTIVPNEGFLYHKGVNKNISWNKHCIHTYKWYTSQLVQILPFQQNSDCYHQQQTFTANLAQLWHSTRLCAGTHSIHFVHKNSNYTHSTTLHFKPVFRRWHPAAWFLPSRSNRHLSPMYAGLHFWCKDMDDVKQTQAELW